MSGKYSVNKHLAGINFSSLSHADRISMLQKILDEKIHGMSYSPYMDGQEPGVEIRNAQIEQRLKIIQPYTHWIRTFSCVEGNENIPGIAKKHDLKVVYDAAHVFGVKYKDESILNYGDISTLSFHATKLFHTIEGGALIINDDSLVEKARYLRNFGIENQESIPELGTNAKMNEFEAAMGLCMLDEMENILKQRKESHEFYTQQLEQYVQLQKKNEDATQSYTYFPITFRSGDEMSRVREALFEKDIAARQYFKPSLDTLPYVEIRNVMTKSRDIASRILVIPMHSGVEPIVSQIIIETLEKMR